MTKGLVLGEKQRHKARKLVNQVHASDPTFVAVSSSTPVEEADTNSIEQATSLAAEKI